MNFQNAHVLTLGGLLIALLPTAAAAGQIRLEVEAFIDGRDHLIIQGNTLQWENLAFSAPGRHQGQNLPTIITTASEGVVFLDRVEWTPTWASEPPTRVGPDGFSSVFAGLTPTIPSSADAVRLEVLAGPSPTSSNSVSIVQQPSRTNGFTTIVEFDDEGPGGSRNYHVALTFNAVPEPSSIVCLSIAGVVCLSRCRH